MTIQSKLFVAIVILLIAGCSQDPVPLADTSNLHPRRAGIETVLPTGADNIQDVGNGWHTFDVMRGDAAGCYLIRLASRGNKGYGFITERPCG